MFLFFVIFSSRLLPLPLLDFSLLFTNFNFQSLRARLIWQVSAGFRVQSLYRVVCHYRRLRGTTTGSIRCRCRIENKLRLKFLLKIVIPATRLPAYQNPLSAQLSSSQLSFINHTTFTSRLFACRPRCAGSFNILKPKLKTVIFYRSLYHRGRPVPSQRF